METISLAGRRVVGFGGVFFNDHSVDEVQALIKLFDYRMKTLDDAFKSFAPQWAAADLMGFNAFVADYALIQARYATAKAVAEAAMLKLDPDAGYLAISKAIRQNYPPDGATLTKGDWADLWKRIADAQKAANVAVIEDHPPIDLANTQSNSVLMDLYRSTAPLDVLAQLTGAQKPSEAIAWIRAHRTGIIIAGTVLVGGILYAIVRR
jgi:hypothetical protein